jgi:hypothetical protein
MPPQPQPTRRFAVGFRAACGILNTFVDTRTACPWRAREYNFQVHYVQHQEIPISGGFYESRALSAYPEMPAHHRDMLARVYSELRTHRYRGLHNQSH